MTEWLTIASAFAQGAGQGTGGRPTSSSANPLTNSWFDGSGWTVATGNASARGGDRAQGENLPLELIVLIVVAAIVGAILWKKL